MEVTQDDSAGPVALPIDDLLDELEKGPLGISEAKPDDDTPKVEVETKADEEDKPEKEPAKKAVDPAAKLQREIESLRAHAEAERKQREQYARLAAQKALEAQRAMARAQTSDYDLISNALESATDKMSSLEQAYAAAFAEGDGAKAAAIQKQMAILGARITQLEDGKSRLEHQAQLQRQRAQQAQARLRQQPPPQQQHADPFEASISHFSEPSKKWIREHRDLVTQPGKWNEVVRYHHVAEDQGLEPDTPDYFAFIEKKLGLRKDDDGDVQVATQKPRRSIPSAPVSRDSVIGGISNKKVTLTPAEIQTANDLGMSKEEYAKYKIQALKDGRYDFQQRI